MKRQYLITLIISAFTFGLGWWSSIMYDFDKGAKQDAIRLDSLNQSDTILRQINRLKITPLQADTIVKDNFEIIVKETDGSVNVWRKFNPKYKFSDFPVTENFIGKAPEQLNFSTCKYGKLYKTASISAANEGAVFAGHYAFAIMGCGTNCQVSTIINLKTGNVYAGPEASGLYDYKLDSKILIVNPPDSNGLYFPCFYCTPEQYLWTGNSFKRLE